MFSYKHFGECAVLFVVRFFFYVTWFHTTIFAMRYIRQNSKCFTHITLQLVGLFSMLKVQLLRVTGVVMDMLAVSDVACLSLALPSVQELWLVCVNLKLRPCLLELLLVLIVALQLAYSQ